MITSLVNLQKNYLNDPTFIPLIASRWLDPPDHSILGALKCVHALSLLFFFINFLNLFILIED